MELTNEFQSIRNWAEKRGIYEKGDPKTQYLKLQEECGELAQALLKDKPREIIDALGDIVVVLVNLTELISNDNAMLTGITLESCVNMAYEEIRNRKGKMENGTFIKE